MNSAINPEQLNEIVEAILNGKYSWACFLILRFAGYDPTHYIPYRTCNRLLKENCQVGRGNQRKTGNLKIVSEDSETQRDRRASYKSSSKIVDLNYLEPVGEKTAQVRGGSLAPWGFRKDQGFSAYN